jgi:hypothetical protein
VQTIFRVTGASGVSMALSDQACTTDASKNKSKELVSHHVHCGGWAERAKTQSIPPITGHLYLQSLGFYNANLHAGTLNTRVTVMHARWRRRTTSVFSSALPDYPHRLGKRFDAAFPLAA